RVCVDRPDFAPTALRSPALLVARAKRGLNALTAAFGAALVDRAVLDAACRALRMDFATAIRANVPRIDASLAPDLRDFAFENFLGALEPAQSIAARHTVGLLDPLSSAAVKDRPDDAL